jgi:hypothetical protein
MLAVQRADKERWMFNTLKYAKMLEEAGFSREQAEISIKILVEIMEDKLASKQDIKDVMQSITQVESKLTIRMGTMLAASIAILTALIKLL